MGGDISRPNQAWLDMMAELGAERRAKLPDTDRYHEDLMRGYEAQETDVEEWRRMNGC